MTPLADLPRKGGHQVTTVKPGDVPGEFVLNLGKGGWVILAPSADAPLPPLAPISSPEGSATNPYPFHPAL